MSFLYAASCHFVSHKQWASDRFPILCHEGISFCSPYDRSQKDTFEAALDGHHIRAFPFLNLKFGFLDFSLSNIPPGRFAAWYVFGGRVEQFEAKQANKFLFRGPVPITDVHEFT